MRVYHKRKSISLKHSNITKSAMYIGSAMSTTSTSMANQPDSIKASAQKWE